MKSTTKAFWSAVSQQCDQLSTKTDHIYMDLSLRDKYIAACDSAYQKCKDENMNKNVQNLDRHKVAAILVTQGLALDIVKRKDGNNVDTDETIFIGKEKAILSCAISYIAQQINIIIKNSGKTLDTISRFILPKAFSCQTDYIDIMCRLLHYGKKENTLSVLDLADHFFLLEYIAISEYYQDKAHEIYQLLKQSVSE